MSQATLESTRAEALFVSTVQRSDNATGAEIRIAVARAVRAHGSGGCAALVAQEFGEHPDTAVARMRWALDAAQAAFSPCPAALVPTPRRSLTAVSG
jgi:hypothetical protein